jgi:hypothetical protein
VAVACGSHHSLALKSDGTVVSWGYNYAGQATTPDGLSNVVAIAADYYHSLALKSDGTVVCWGDNGSGQSTPPAWLTNAGGISAGYYFSLALVGNPSAQMPPQIWRQPLGQTIAQNQSVILMPFTTGSLPLNYQWLLNGSPVIGQTNRWLMLTSAQPAQSGNYQLVVTNGGGSVTSAVAAVSVLIPPTITQQPSSQTLIQGTTANLSAGVDGSAPLAFSWTFNGTPLSDGGQFSGNATTNLTISNVQPPNAGNYALTVSNPVGSSTSIVASLSVLVPPSISQQPTDQTAIVGSSAAFSVVADGSAPLNYQWLLNNTNIDGAIGSTLTLTNVQFSQAGNYAVVVTNAAGSITSSNAVLTVTLPPVVPVITGFSPAKGFVGTTVTISGTNFSPTASNNIVRFGAVKANVLSTGQGTLVVSVPAGATFAPIAVTVNGLSAFSLNPFLPTFGGDGSAISGSTFATRQNLATPDGPMQTVIADMDGDGKPDMVIANVFAHLLSLFRNITVPGSGTLAFQARVDLSAIPSSTDNPIGMVVGDVDSDGRLDILICNRSANQMLIYRNISSPGTLNASSFAAPMAFAAASDPRHVRLADIDLDGRPEMIVASYGANTISLFRNTSMPGTISFASRVDFAAAGIYDVAIADLDSDGKPDIAAVNASATSISIYRNTSAQGAINSSTLSAPTNFPSLGTGSSIMALDIDGDGLPDLVAGSTYGNSISVFRNQSTPGAFSFAPHLDFGLLGWDHDVAAADFNGDGKVDIAADGELNSFIALFQNNASAGSFSNSSLGSRVDFGTGWNAWGVSVGDLDGDGRPDAVLGNSYDSTISIYQNQTPFGTPLVIQSPTNTIVAVGNTAVLVGSATGLAPLSYQWYFNGSVLTNGARISGTDLSTLVISNAQVADSGSYYFVVTNTVGVSTSLVASLSVVIVPPSITQQPLSQTNLVGGSANFSAVVSGSLPMSFQWFTNGTAVFDTARISGATTPSLVIANLQTNDMAGYFVIATNAGGSITSSIANLTVIVPPNIVQQPSDQAVTVGSNAVFSVIADGLQPLAYVWYFGTTALNDNDRISGSTNSILTISNAQTSDAGTYYVQIIDAAGTSISSTSVVLTVAVPPAITVQPVSRSVPPGLPTSFSASASGTVLQYQWQLNGTNIPGATGSSYNIAAVAANHLGLYHLIVSNAAGTVVSADAKLTFGNVAAWGRNLSGESLPPADLTNAFAVAGSFGASFAARADGTVVAWGSGTATNVPASGTNVVALAANGGTVVLRADGTIIGWNFGASAQIPVPAASNIVAVAAGNNFGFALRAEGTLVPWGLSPLTNVPAGLNHVTSIACGVSHSLALKDDGSVVSWGLGSVTNVPFNVTNVIGIAAGYSHSLALKADGTVTAWGSGTGTNLPSALTNVAAIFCGGYGQVRTELLSSGEIIVTAKQFHPPLSPI